MEEETQPLTRDELRALAPSFILGSALVDEIERLEREGVVFYEELDAHKGPYPARVRWLLLGEEPSGDEVAWNVASRREEALALVRKDKDFLRVRLEDFSLWRATKEAHGRLEEQVRVAPAESRLIWALGTHLGYTPERQAAYFPVVEPDHWGQDLSGLLAYDFERRLDEQRPSWLDVLRSKDKRVAEEAARYLGDPADPEKVVMTLVSRRLCNLEREIDKTLKAERHAHKQEVARQETEAKERQLDDAWSGFFTDDAAPAAPEVAPLGEPPRERPVAPQLSDADERRVS